MRRPSSWAGIDLSPLPHEGSLTPCLRLAIRNVTSPARMAALVKSSPGSTRSLLSASVVDTEKVSAMFGWDLPTAAEVSLYRLFADRICDIVNPYIRICPECWRSWYHSPWFQLPFVSLCPIHKVPLTSKCPRCGRGLGQLSLDRHLLKSPFQCGECPSDWELDIDPHLAFRERTELIASAFRVIEEWIVDSIPRLGLVRWLSRAAPAAPRTLSSEWWNLIAGLSPLNSLVGPPTEPIRVDVWTSRPRGFAAEVSARRAAWGYWAALAELGRRFPEAESEWLKHWRGTRHAAHSSEFHAAINGWTDKAHLACTRWAKLLEERPGSDMPRASYIALRLAFDKPMQWSDGLPQMARIGMETPAMPIATARAFYIGKFVAVWRRLLQDRSQSLLDLAEFAAFGSQPLRAEALRENVLIGVQVAPHLQPEELPNMLKLTRFVRRWRCDESSELSDDRCFLWMLGQVLDRNGI